MNKTILVSRETKVNKNTGFVIPVSKTEGTMIGVDGRYFYLTEPHEYEFGVPVINRFSREYWTIKK